MIISTVTGETSVHTIELAVQGAPPLKCDYEYHDVTGLRITYQDDKVTALTVLGIAENSGEAEEISTRMDRYDMVAEWIRDEVDKNRPSRRRSAYLAEA